MLKDWAKNIEWEKRVKAVCKPCWELKYCPYGPLVESFQLSKEKSKNCKVFGHLCPVYKVAEPFTETKELRNISRNIPRNVQIRVNRRDNSLCQICSSHLLEKDIHFDHIIPWSKGGSSDENNIRVLCKKCNLERGNNFEKEMLISNLQEKLSGLIEITQEMLYDIIVSLLILINFKKIKKDKVNIDDVIGNIDSDIDRDSIEIIYRLAFELDDYISNYITQEFNKNECEKIKYRLGYKDLKVHSIKEIISKYKTTYYKYKMIENRLFNYIGINIEYLEDKNDLIDKDYLKVNSMNTYYITILNNLKEKQNKENETATFINNE